MQGGGSDLIFPHHEMSAGEAQVADPGQPFARAYAHAGMVAYDGEKMSKSKGNLVFVSALRFSEVDPMAIRLVRGRLFTSADDTAAPGAVIVSATDEDRGVKWWNLGADGRYADALMTKLWDARRRPYINLDENGVGHIPVEDMFPHMDGKVVFKNAVEKMITSVVGMCWENKLEVQDGAVSVAKDLAGKPTSCDAVSSLPPTATVPLSTGYAPPIALMGTA